MGQVLAAAMALGALQVQALQAAVKVVRGRVDKDGKEDYPAIIEHLLAPLIALVSPTKLKEAHQRACTLPDTRAHHTLVVDADGALALALGHDLESAARPQREDTLAVMLQAAKGVRKAYLHPVAAHSAAHTGDAEHSGGLATHGLIHRRGCANFAVLLFGSISPCAPPVIPCVDPPPLRRQCRRGAQCGRVGAGLVVCRGAGLCAWRNETVVTVA